MRETYVRAMDVVYLASIWMSGLALIVMTIVIPIGVFNRYVLGSGSQWPEPLAILCMVVFTFLGAAASYRAGVLDGNDADAPETWLTTSGLRCDERVLRGLRRAH